MSGAAVLNGTRAFRLAWFDGEQFQASPYGYVEATAALTAAPTLNLARLCRTRPAYTHVAAFEGEKLIDVRPLEAAA